MLAVSRLRLCLRRCQKTQTRQPSTHLIGLIIGRSDPVEDIGPFDVTIVVIYLVFAAMLGLYFSRRQKPTENYFPAGRNIPGRVVGVSCLGTIVSSATFVGHPDNVYHKNMYLVPTHIVPSFVILFVTKELVVFYRQTLKKTVYTYEVLEVPDRILPYFIKTRFPGTCRY